MCWSFCNNFFSDVQCTHFVYIFASFISGKFSFIRSLNIVSYIRISIIHTLDLFWLRNNNFLSKTLKVFVFLYFCAFRNGLFFLFDAFNVTFIYFIVLLFCFLFYSDTLLFTTFIFWSFSLGPTMSCLNSSFSGLWFLNKLFQEYYIFYNFWPDLRIFFPTYCLPYSFP